MNQPDRQRRRWQYSLGTLLLMMTAACVAAWWFGRIERLDRRYFPMAVGDKWVYRAADGAQVVFEVFRTTTVNLSECFVVQRSIGAHRVDFYVEVKDDGVWIHQIGETRFVPPQQQFAFPTVASDTWGFSGTADGHSYEFVGENQGIETVIVPYGTVDAFRVQLSGTTQSQFWLAKGIGVVWLWGKSSDEHDPSPAAAPFDWRLMEFTRQ